MHVLSAVRMYARPSVRPFVRPTRSSLVDFVVAAGSKNTEHSLASTAQRSRCVAAAIEFP